MNNYHEALKYLEYAPLEGKLYFKFINPQWNRTRPIDKPVGSFQKRRSRGNPCKGRWVLNFNVQGRGGKNSKLSMATLVWLMHDRQIPEGFAVTSKYEDSIRIEDLYLKKVKETK